MTERESFVASMRDNPADDTARLAFADWIDDRGEHDRAELIRVQVARARLNPRPVLRIVTGFERRYRPAVVEHRPESRKGRIARAVLEFEGEFEFPVGAMISPGVCFDAIEPRAEWNPDAPVRIRAVGCVVERLNPALRGDGSIALAGHVTGIPCPVRAEVDALDARAAALMLKIPFGEFCPTSFVWHIDAGSFDAPQDNGAVLVRRGFAEHVRCSWEDWVRWADWFRANHPCERVTLTTRPSTNMVEMNRTVEFQLWNRKARALRSSEETDRIISQTALMDDIHRELLAKEWSGTSFALPGQHFPMEVPPNAISDYTAQLFGTIAQGLGIPPNLINGGNGT